MASDFTLPQLDTITTLDDIRKMKDAEFVRTIQDKRVKMIVTDNEVSSVVISPDLYNVFLEAVEKLKATQSGVGAVATA